MDQLDLDSWLENKKYLDKLKLIRIIERKLNNIKKDLMNRQYKNGYCPHPDQSIDDYTTYNDYRKGKRKLLCKQCGKAWEEPIRRPEE